MIDCDRLIGFKVFAEKSSLATNLTEPSFSKMCTSFKSIRRFSWLFWFARFGFQGFVNNFYLQGSVGKVCIVRFFLQGLIDKVLIKRSGFLKFCYARY